MFCFGVGTRLPVCSDGHFRFNSFSSGSNSSSANYTGLGGAGRTWEVALILLCLRTLSQLVWSSSVLGVNFLHFPMSELLQGKISSLNNQLVVTAESPSRAEGCLDVRTQDEASLARGSWGNHVANLLSFSWFCKSDTFRGDLPSAAIHLSLSLFFLFSWHSSSWLLSYSSPFLSNKNMSL